MSDVDILIRDAYRRARMPEGLKAATLAHIENGRPSAGHATFDGSDDAVFSPLYAPDFQATDDSGDACAAVRQRARRTRRARWTLSRKFAAAAAACAVVAAVGVGGFAFAMTPVAHVGIDVNPSFELSVNRFDRVVDARAVNDDASDVLARLDMEGMSYEEAMDELAQACDTYIEEGVVVEVGVACGDAARCEAIESAALRSFDQGGAEVHCGRLDDEQRQAAAKAGMGLGRYRVYETLVAAGVDISQEEAAGMSMAELRALAAQSGVDTCDSACGGGRAMGWGPSDGEGHGRGHGRWAQGEDAGRGGQAGQGGGQGQGWGHRDS